MATRVVTRDERDETLKRIARFGTERVVSEVENDDGTITITTDRLAESKLETR